MENQMSKVGTVEVRIIDEITTLHNEILGYYKRSLNSVETYMSTL